MCSSDLLAGIFRYQLLSDPEESERRRKTLPEHSTEKPEEILLGDRGIQLILVAWLAMATVIGAAHHTSLLPPHASQP